MKTNIGSVSSGYQRITLIVWENPRSYPPRSPQSRTAATTATKPMAPNTRCPVNSISIMVENISAAISSYDIRRSHP